MRAEDETREDSEEDASDITAPSIGPNTTIDRDDPEERLARHDQSDVDAMGLDKRREVIGGKYGPGIGKQVRLYGGVLIVIVALVIGFIVLVGQFDRSEANYEDQAPWSDPGAEQTPPKPLE